MLCKPSRMMSWWKLKMERRLSRWMEREKELKMEVIMNRRTPWGGSAGCESIASSWCIILALLGISVIDSWAYILVEEKDPRDFVKTWIGGASYESWRSATHYPPSYSWFSKSTWTWALSLHFNEVEVASQTKNWHWKATLGWTNTGTSKDESPVSAWFSRKRKDSLFNLDWQSISNFSWYPQKLLIWKSDPQLCISDIAIASWLFKLYCWSSSTTQKDRIALYVYFSRFSFLWYV